MKTVRKKVRKRRKGASIFVSDNINTWRMTCARVQRQRGVRTQKKHTGEEQP